MTTPDARWRSETQLQDGVIAAEYTWKGGRGEAAGEVEAIPGTEFRGQFLAFPQGNWNAAVGLVGYEQMVLRQEAGEEKPAPMLVSRIIGQVPNLLPTRAVVAGIAQSPAASTEAVAKLTLLDRHVRPIICLMHGEVFEGGAANIGRDVSRIRGDVAKARAKGGGEGCGDGFRRRSRGDGGGIGLFLGTHGRVGSGARGA